MLILTALFDRQDRLGFLSLLGLWPLLTVYSPFAALALICFAVEMWLTESPLVSEAGGLLVAGTVALFVSLPSLASLVWAVWLTLRGSTWRVAAILAVWLVNALGWLWLVRSVGDID